MSLFTHGFRSRTITDDTCDLNYQPHPSLLLDSPPGSPTTLDDYRQRDYRQSFEDVHEVTFKAHAQIIINSSATFGSVVAFDTEGGPGFEHVTLCCYDEQDCRYFAVIEPALYDTLPAVCCNAGCMLLVYGDKEITWMAQQGIIPLADVRDLQQRWSDTFLVALLGDDGVLRDMRLPPIQSSFAMSRITAGKVYVKETDRDAFFYPLRVPGNLGPSIWRARPLLSEHVKYAIADVLALFTILHPTRHLPPPPAD